MKKKKAIKTVLVTIFTIVVVGFFLNWFLTYRLEQFLRNEITDRVSKATNGFYKISFSDLSIGFFNGELLIQNIVLYPDSAVFKRWEAQDSLPNEYLDLKIKSIYFKGINLPWRLNYKKLHFDLFEIQQPDINIFDSQSSNRRKKIRTVREKTLYEMIEPYIDELSVKKMNLENASVSYITEQDNVVPSIYSLNDVSFHAYGFVLNKESSKSGKLLYCDEFDFTTHKKQNILSNEQFSLDVDKINLATKDSIVLFEKIELTPQKELWTEKNLSPDNYVDAQVGMVKVSGLYFTRIDGLNFLNAKLFEIKESNIQYFDTNPDTTEIAQKNPAKDINNTPQSLYSIISPLLNSVEINKITIGGSAFKYSNASGDSTDVYTLQELKFTANHFRVDSTSFNEKRFLYSDNFAVYAKDIQGRAPSKNSVFHIDLMDLSTEAEYFLIKNINLKPITPDYKYNYMSGKIDSIYATGVKYDKGVELNTLTIEKPIVEYIKVPGKIRKIKNIDADTTVITNFVSSPNIIIPIFNHLSIKDIHINKGNVTFTDKSKPKDITTYKLPYFDFAASGFLISTETIQNADFYFLCDDFTFKFSDFNNFLPGKDYRLIVNRGEVLGKKGFIQLRGIELIPQESTWKHAPDTYLSLKSPLLEISGLDYISASKHNIINFNSFNLESPDIKITKTDNQENISKKKSAFIFDKILSDNIRITNAAIEQIDTKTHSNFKSTFNDLKISELYADDDKNISIGKLMLQSPVISSVSQTKTDKGSTSFFPLDNSIKIGELNVSSLMADIQGHDLKLNTALQSFKLEDLDWNRSTLKLADMHITEPTVKIIQYAENKNDTAHKNVDKKDIYDKLKNIAQNISIGNFDLINLHFDYKNTRGNKFDNQRINSTNLNFTNLQVDTKQKTYTLGNIGFNTENLEFPIADGFYTLSLGYIDLNKNSKSLSVNEVRMKSTYPKNEFAYLHPTHQDWFDITVGKINADGVDIPEYFSNKIMNIDSIRIDDVTLLNFKNKKIKTEPRSMPMIYEGLQNLPVKLNVNKLDVNNFNVEYEELDAKGTMPGKIFLTNMNGRFSGFTNIVSSPEQYITLDADGNFMGSGKFTAIWKIPVSPDNDQFLLSSKLDEFDLTELNQLITPLAPVKIERGMVKGMNFSTTASSKGAKVDMTLLYNDLKINMLKSKDSMLVTDKFLTKVVNLIIKDDNPKNKKNAKPREVHASIKRDPYHSTFNYFWQILRPPLTESVGVSKKEQNFARGIGEFIGKVKSLFRKKEKTEK